MHEAMTIIQRPALERTATVKIMGAVVLPSAHKDRDVLREIVERADVLGVEPSGEAWILVRVTRPAFEHLATMEAVTEDDEDTEGDPHGLTHDGRSPVLLAGKRSTPGFSEDDEPSDDDEPTADDEDDAQPEFQF